MTTHEQLERKIAELHEKMFALQKEIESVERELVKAKDTDGWPREGDSYWCIAPYGEVINETFEYIPVCRFYIAIGNCFRTKKEAEFTIERLKVLAEMRKFAFEPDWDDVKQSKWVIIRDHNFITLREYHTCNQGLVCFDSKRTARNCIKAIGEERLKKYYFGVKDDG